MASISVLTINIWNRSGPWERRFALLREGIAALEPDVIGLQEVLSDGTHDLAQEILEGLGYEVTFAEAKGMGPGFAFGNAIASRHPIVRHESVSLPAAGTKQRRVLLLAQVETSLGTLPFACTHLAWRRDHGFVREAQVEAIADQLRAWPGGDLPVVLVGDFNAPPEADEIRFLKGLTSMSGRSFFLHDAFELCGEGPGLTRDPARNPFAAMEQKVARRVDYVFVGPWGPRGRGRPVEARLALDEVEDGVAPSDHFGVFVRLQV